ncbi:unnamed protein product [Adineta ricciae]|uniref:Kinesin light chain n=1 Tax=Adineta ricciae TaxID=249248 RepID=A0A815JWE0_ADIRI|nr:unnamed protein product [Adineta ricciae]CAF1381979.1 unnamed protein product [Adineta ricciae]
MQDVVMIWLDNHIDHNNADCQLTIAQLEHITDNVTTFTDNDECVEYILNCNDHQVYLIVSGALGQYLVRCIHDIPLLHSIFIFCQNKSYHEQWAKHWNKIKDVFTDITSLCQAIQNTLPQDEPNVTPISFVPSGKRLDLLNPSFMYTQLFKEILLTIEFEDKHIEEFVKHHPGLITLNGTHSTDVKQLVRDYRAKKPIWWYTRDNSLHSMLNDALRIMDGDVLVRMGFFVTDLHRNIEQLHKEQFVNTTWSSLVFTVYRGQGLSHTDFEELRNTKGGLMSFNSFFSTSTKRDISSLYAESNANNPKLVGILFTIQVDPSQSTTPFAFVGNHGRFLQESELLFSMHTVFRIHDIKVIDTDRPLYEVNISLTLDSDEELRTLTAHIRRESHLDGKGWTPLGQLLIQLGQHDTAEPIYTALLNQTSDDSDAGLIYHQLGCIRYEQGLFEEAVTLYAKSRVLLEKSLPANHPSIATSFGSIGSVYDSMGDYRKALEYYEKTLSIQQQSLPANHPSIAISYNNIGSVYQNMGDYPKALEYHEKALSIRQQSLPANHPSIATSFGNIGSVYDSMGDYPKALEYYEKTLLIEQQSLPANHPSIATSFGNIGSVYDSMGDYRKALEYYEKTLSIEQQSLPANHPSIATSHNNIGMVYKNMGDYRKALEYYEKTLSIQQQSLPANHPSIATSYNNIGMVYKNMGDYRKALEYYEKTLSIQQQSLPANHPSIATSYNNTGMVYYNMGDYPKAHFYCERAVQIAKCSMLPNNPHLLTYARNLECVRNGLQHSSFRAIK